MEIGTELNHYRILGPLGEGGMGQVYRAEDTRLRREVAIKVLPAEVASDPERLARLEREAQLLARLEHPNVAAVYGLEESGSTRFLVMQLVEGETLCDRIADGSLTVETALPLALQIAEGLEAAHERGIVHRDLKPANIMVTPEGGVRVLDFGLAKGLGPDGEPDSRGPELTASPTMLAPTQAGMILGTASYMSPEQARGKAVDKRTDIWAFGCVLYEMLAGEQVFGGETVTDILAGIVHREPDLEQLPTGTPWRLRRLLERCLQKDPLRRLRDIGEARIALERVLREPNEPEPATAATEEVVAGNVPRWVLPATLIAMLVTALATWALGRTTPEESPADNPGVFVLTEGVNLNLFDRAPRLSPDGSRAIFHDGQSLLVRDLDALEARRLPATESATFPFWSADSHHVGFVSEGRLWRVPAAGGQRTLVTAVAELEGAWWRPDDTIVFTDDAGVWSVGARGGDPELIMPIDELPVDDLNDLHYPSVLPGGAGILFRVHGRESLGGIGLWDGSRARLLLEAAPGERLDDVVFAPTGHLLYTRAGSTNQGVWAVAFDLSTLEIVGEPFLVRAGFALGGLSEDGSMLLAEGVLDITLELTWVGRDGTPGEPFGPVVGFYPPMPDLAPDGNRVAVQLEQENGSDIWVLDARGGRLRVTADPTNEYRPAWHPDGERIAYTVVTESGREIWIRDLSGDAPPVRVAEGDYAAFSPDGRWLVFANQPAPDAPLNLWRLELEEGGDPARLFTSPHSEGVPAISPDGRWLAYASEESGQTEIQVRRYPGGGERRVISTNGGALPRWSPDGRELYYLEPGGGVNVVAIDSPEFGVPEVAISPVMPGLSAVIATPFVGYDVDPAGGRFLVVQQAGGEEGSRLVLLQNGIAALRDR